jgi:hypothetical protein
LIFTRGQANEATRAKSNAALKAAATDTNFLELYDYKGRGYFRFVSRDSRGYNFCFTE